MATPYDMTPARIQAHNCAELDFGESIMKLRLTEEQLRRMEEMIYDRVLREAWWETQLLGTMVDRLHPGDPLVKEYRGSA